MARIDRPCAFRVDLIEFERGWGSRVDDILFFDNEPEARKYVEDFNSRNTEKTVPDWYMIAEYVGQV